jgi:septum formation protein
MDSQLTHFPFQLVLGSSSPRRQQLLRDLGLEFEIRTKETDETFSEDLNVYDVPGILAKRKAAALLETLTDKELLICSDTVVILNQHILGKPADLVEAKKIIHALSNATHEVVTGVCLQTKTHSHTFSVRTAVTFKNLEESEIDYYIRHYNVLDKAGAYGIQEWIGMIGVQNINGSYYNVMGLPVFELWEELQKIKNAIN